MKSIKIIVGTFALAAIALAPVANAAQMLRPASCNQKLVNCIDQASINFDCCAYGADRTTEGLLSDYCEAAPLSAFAAPAAPSKGTSVPACLLVFNATTTACNVAYAICTVTTPAPSKNAQ